MFIIGYAKNISIVHDHPVKVLTADVMLATTLFVGGILMMARVFPGAAYGALPSSVAFVYVLSVLAVGAFLVLKDEPEYQRLFPERPETVKDKTKKFEDRLSQITQSNNAYTGMRALLEKTIQELSQDNLAPKVKEELTQLKSELEKELQPEKSTR